MPLLISKSFKQLVLLALCLTYMSPLLAQSNDFTREQAITELKTIRQAITDYHPSPFRYISKESWSSQYQEVQSIIEKKNTITTFEYIQLVSPLIGIIRDEHSKLFPNKDFIQNTIATHRLFPFEVSKSSESTFIIRRVIDSSIDPKYIGKEISMINGRRVTDIMEALKLCGGSSASSDYSGTLYHALNYDNFSRLYFLCVDQSETFEIQFSSGQNESFPGYRPQKRTTTLHQFNPETSPEIYLAPDNSIAHLRVSSFWPEAFNLSFRQYEEKIDDFFQQVKDRQIQKVVIDVRGNRGGTPFLSTYLAGYFFQQPFKPFQQVTARRKAAEDFSKQFKGVRKPTFQSGSDVVTLPKRLAGFETHHEKSLIFEGEVVVLIDAGTGSASTIFASLMSQLNNISFQGEETLGDANRTTGGQYKVFELPYSKLALRIPLLLFHHGPDEPAYGIKADSPVMDLHMLPAKQ